MTSTPSLGTLWVGLRLAGSQRHIGSGNAQGARIAVALGLAMAVAGGCSGPKPIPVKGRITYGEGDWPQKGRLYFLPEPVSGTFAKPGFAEFDVEGNFVITTFQPGDGLLPGDYRVNVECWQVPPSMTSPRPPQSYVPAMYQSGATSGFAAHVAADSPGPVELKFDVPTR